MTDDDSRSRLRIGGWIPPYQDSGPVAPGPGPAGGPATTTAGPSLTPVWQRRWILLLGLVVVLLAAVLGYLNADRDERPRGGPQLPAPVFPAFSPEPAVSVIPAPPSPPPAATTVPVATHRPVTTQPSRAVTTRPRTSSPSPSAARLTPGTTVGLEEAGRPGIRVRHRDFRGRVDLIRSAQDRADATFTVRAGLADPGCVSLEAVNYPGRFLRHRDFQIVLDRRDGSRLFTMDATFCAVPADRSTVTLASVNYPDRAIVERDGRLLLGRGGTAFRIRAPL